MHETAAVLVWLDGLLGGSPYPSSADLVSEALLSWGLLSRGIAACLVITLASLYWQIPALMGRKGIYPATDMLTAARRDFPSPLERLRCHSRHSLDKGQR